MFRKELADIVIKNCGHESEKTVLFLNLCEQDYDFCFLYKVAMTLISRV